MSETKETKEHFWGDPTATLDWCEENYIVHKYIAEFINTTTNLIFISLAIFGIHSTLKYGLSFRNVLGYAGIALVGIGSWCFHMTLLYEFQLLDELPMIYTTCILTHNIFETGEKRRFGLYLPLALFTYASGVTAAYLYINDPVFHQVSYALLVSIINFRSYYLLTQIHKASIKIRMKRLLFTAWTMFGLGFLFWNIDNIACHQLRQSRHKIGMPLSHLLELHGWWHIGTAFGTYYWIVFSSYIRVILLRKENEYNIKWGLGFVPYVVKVSKNSRKEMKLGSKVE
ncbi:12899_t:CDS:2 [Funneliformis mosseae]|uniref:12899_t:CDS:1 n=1 Tax=Funneliformis mosseae TaxID=27381 RepID=A0A9N9B239_FUNMO|nr:12899_t:CDS:2 [Funneliformis mosseae]